MGQVTRTEHSGITSITPTWLVLRACRLLHNSAHHDLFSFPASVLLLHQCGCGDKRMPAKECGASWVGHGGGQARASPCSQPGVVNGKTGVGWKSPFPVQGPGRSQHWYCRCRVCDVGEDGGTRPEVTAGLARKTYPDPHRDPSPPWSWLCVKGPKPLPVLPKGQKPLSMHDP